jgi:endogenous inhibitor of DNA gyrase (YacG/DUF329 family)
MPDRSRCPNCGEHVSPYAAGCAVCGADIDFRRWDSGPTRIKRAGSWLSALSFGGTQQRVHPLILWGLVLFGGSIVAAAVAAVSGLFG